MILFFIPKHTLKWDTIDVKLDNMPLALKNHDKILNFKIHHISKLNIMI
jgi:hypothetical protein